MPSEPLIQVLVSARFQRDLQNLAKRYRSIQQDLQPVVAQLQAGELPGDQVVGTGYSIYKVRIKNRDIRKGKSGGYRLIYYAKLANQIILITLYSKSDQGSITAGEIRKIVSEHERTSP